MDRTEDKINKHLSLSQSAYRKSRSITYVIWAHRWIAAKTQVQDIAIYITGIDMSSAFDKIYRDELFNIVEEFLDEDDLRILSTLLAETNLEVKEKMPKQSPLNLTSDYLKETVSVVHSSHRAFQQMKDEMQKEPIYFRDINPRWV